MITPILLCGGSGTRLWPLSRESYPKQFADVVGEDSLFQASARRCIGDGFADPVVITGNAFRFIVTEQLDECLIAPGSILIEPEGRNTAPAVLISALHVLRHRPDDLILIMPSDHAVADPDLFRATVAQGCAAAGAGQIVTFGIAPTRAETGYGWLERGAETTDGAYNLERFIEKPDAETATRLLADDRYMWNAGVFLAQAKTLVAAYQTHAPDMLALAERALANATDDLGFTRIDPVAWAGMPDISIDYAIMEKAKNISLVPFQGDWSDLGNWQSVWQETTRDKDGNARSANTTALDCKDSLLRSESDGIELVGIGLTNIVAVAMGDAVMVADMSQAQNVKQAVTNLKAREAKQAVQLPVDYRPWGWFETLVLGDRFQVKRIHVHAGASLSLQSHDHRSEHWIVVEGVAQVTIDDTEKQLSENQSVYIPVGSKHRLANPGPAPMVLIEVQTGSYFGEDDITRYEDRYARG
ncbi:mannose-1-phosphate guanylyltransferase/mannose-6-phosphate isomerase [Rhodophyticola sp. CCM32]|uniref:mannose-1-phosphate guanylyltransferase/mannose-6-phosphate isomerase n=1 Tax=Rhodophyticola sp. CCM32 TaxID=2916397 RepID=UPI00107F1EB9|nr:mannose-1-phosphate guanylyltransferase/mannose-6-phosphate isomerase [Rhodophyticola sp. CCM32]QBY02240.1 mannose-1-phosphate guanylyltransferase/mannose-6-phosphate isomerase [Rhodophyticola sp. CCM32]